MNIMSKGIATQTILLLLIGIVVAGILIFLVYRYLIGAPLSQEECRARAISWCTTCKNFQDANSKPNWDAPDGPSFGGELNTCATTYFTGQPSACNSGAKSWCAGFISTQ